jgi:threonylcarbamoyladenosine tRNA methylthiotransferase MtaB
VRVYLDSIGCRLNQAEIERYTHQFCAAGCALAAKPEEAELAVINTCAVTEAAASDSRQKIRWMSRSGVKQIIVTGCWASLFAEEAAALPAVCVVIPNDEKDELVRDILAGKVNLPPLLKTSDQESPQPLISEEDESFQPVCEARLRTRAFIKAQDGCNNRCTFCITTLARGAARSRSIDEVLEDIESTTGAKEVVLTGLHLGSWGRDFSPALRLRHLVQAILDRTDLPRLRLSSMEPWDLEPELVELWADQRLCQHFHLPLQSGCSATLRRMARKTTPESYCELVAMVRSVAPEAAITTDIITGFPGESESEFLESLAFVRNIHFAGGHVFTYSARSGTAAANMPGQAPYPVRKERNACMQTIFREAARSYQASFVNRVLPVLWERGTPSGKMDFEMSGLTGNYLRVKAHASQDLWNQITPVCLNALVDGHIEGRIIQG